MSGAPITQVVGMAERGRSEAVATTCGVLVAAGLLAVMGYAASRTDTSLPESAPTASDALPATTTEPVRPAAEAVKPTPSRARGRVVAGDWITRMSRSTGIGPVALKAYGTAALRLADEQPRCRLGWTTLAGIGAIESGHGTTGGSVLRPDGTTSQPILGPALDGTAGTAAIRSDADSVRWHGDAVWDHAVGPMQFIPSTWRKWGSDGDGDGVEDPSNVFDAAYAAARYLCASGGDLTTGEGWSRAVFSYNHSEDYVRAILARANDYAD
ncbi:MAG: lytic murein transglycosylase [Aeromicrobium sp.]|jgi:membrane-bound lytic murein transglycosylase B|nr:lytic murein transglycosylase [Aeromicrobium sp.]